MALWLKVNIAKQTLALLDDEKILKIYPVSTGKKGVGEQIGSEQTPRGWHQIHSKIGGDAPTNTVFVAREPTGEIFAEPLRTAFPQRDWILTRILHLNGTEPGKNQGGDVDTFSRYIYIHGTPDSTPMQIPGSHGCIRMLNDDIIELFDLIPTSTKVLIEE